MNASTRIKRLAGILAVGCVLGLGATRAEAQGFGYYGGEPGHHHHHNGCHGSGRGGYTAGYGGYGVGYGGAPTQYYGNGGHDLTPHWHTTQTPVGSFAWFGNGAHDLAPHEHTNSPYGGYRGYSPSPFGGVTTSYYNSTPYIYVPW